MEPSDKISPSLFCSVFNTARTELKSAINSKACGWAGAMAGIAQNIERYNSGYRLAWKHISELQKRVNPNIALRLHASIWRQLKEGARDPFSMAFEALKALAERSDSGTK
jgi:hypothetical protein